MKITLRLMLVVLKLLKKKLLLKRLIILLENMFNNLVVAVNMDIALLMLNQANLVKVLSSSTKLRVGQFHANLLSR